MGQGPQICRGVFLACGGAASVRARQRANMFSRVAPKAKHAGASGTGASYCSARLTQSPRATGRCRPADKIALQEQ
jgi:hypothetical protein